jgi:hypothetical protein
MAEYYTKLYLKMQGASGSQVFTDSSSYGKTVTVVGNVEHDTSQIPPITGAVSSGKFPGTGSYLTLVDSADWYFGADPFTIKTWVRLNGWVRTVIGICGQYVDADNFWYIRLTDTTPSKYLSFTVKVSGTTIADYHTIVPSNFGDWKHIEVVRNGTNVYLFVGGVSQKLTVHTAISTNEVPNLAAVLEVGASENHTYVMNGWLAYFQILKGKALHTADFTPPTIEPSMIPIVTTQPATAVMPTTLTANCEITDAGDYDLGVTTRGICYKVGTTGDPTVDDSTVHEHTGIYTEGAFTEAVTGLTRATGYRLRAYIIEGAYAYYGATVQETTLTGIPDVSTLAYSALAPTTLTAHSEITGINGLNATRRGFCYMEGVEGDPVLGGGGVTEVHETDGSFGVEAYSYDITSLKASHNYRLRAYVSNTNGTAYGDTIQVSTPAALGINISTKTHIHLWVKSNVTLELGDIQLLLDDTPACTSPIETIDLPALVADTWTRCSLPLAAAASDLDLQSWGIKVVRDKGAMVISVDDIRAVLEYTGTVDDLWSATTLNDTFIYTNGVDVMQKYDGTTAAILAGTPPKAKSVTSFYNRLIATGTIETGTAYPFRVRWSSAGTIETWTGGTSGYVDLVDTPDWCVAGKLLNDKCFIYKETSIWELVYVGGTTVFLPKMRVGVNGTKAANSIQGVKDKHFFWSSDAIYAFDGLYVTPLDRNIFPLLYRTGDKIVALTYPKRVCSTYIEEAGEYWICLPTVNSAGVPETLFKRSKDGSWTRHGEMYITCFGHYSYVATIVTWATAVGTWLTQLYGSWRRRSLPGAAPTLLISWYNGQVYEDDRSTTSSGNMVFETKDFLFGHAHRCTEVRVLYQKGPCTIYYSVNSGNTWILLGTLVYMSDWTEGVKYFNITTQRVRFKIETTASEFELKWVEPWYIPRVRSESLRGN